MCIEKLQLSKKRPNYSPLPRWERVGVRGIIPRPLPPQSSPVKGEYNIGNYFLIHK